MHYFQTHFSIKARNHGCVTHYQYLMVEALAQGFHFVEKVVKNPGSKPFLQCMFAMILHEHMLVSISLAKNKKYDLCNEDEANEAKAHGTKLLRFSDFGTGIPLGLRPMLSIY